MVSLAAVAPATLLALYSAMGILVTVQEVQLVAKGHKILHYKSLFNLFVAVWMLLRVLFWLVDLTGADLPQMLQDLIFWLPHTAMFLTFATLALFLVRVLSGPNWSGMLRRKYLAIYGSVAAVNVVATFILSALDAQFASVQADDGQQAVQDAESIENGILFLLLAGVFTYLGRQLRRLAVWELSRASVFMLSPTTVSWAVWCLAAIFTSRSLWNFLTASQVVDISTSDSGLTSALTTIGLYVLWEFAPLVLLLTTIASGVKGSAASAEAVKGAAHLGVFEAIDQLESELAAEAAQGATGGASAIISGGDRDDLASSSGGGGGYDDMSLNSGRKDYESSPMLSRDQQQSSNSYGHNSGKQSQDSYGASSNGFGNSGGLGVSGGLIGSSGPGLAFAGGIGMASVGPFGRSGLSTPGFLTPTGPGRGPAAVTSAGYPPLGLSIHAPSQQQQQFLGSASGSSSAARSGILGASSTSQLYGPGYGVAAAYGTPGGASAGSDGTPLSPSSADEEGSPQHAVAHAMAGLYSTGAGAAAMTSGAGGGGLARVGSGFLFASDPSLGFSTQLQAQQQPQLQLAGAGFLSAQQNAMRRTTYMPPQIPMSTLSHNQHQQPTTPHVTGASGAPADHTQYQYAGAIGMQRAGSTHDLLQSQPAVFR